MQSEETAAGPPPAVAAAALDERLGEAAEALAQGWYDEVLLVCQAVLTERPRCPEAVFLLGLTSFDLGDPVRGLGLVETAHELDPEVREYADALAALYAKLAKVNEALFYAKVSTTLAPHPRLDTLLPDFAARHDRVELRENLLVAAREFCQTKHLACLVGRRAGGEAVVERVGQTREQGRMGHVFQRLLCRNSRPTSEIS